MSQVFISYSRVDAAFVELFIRRLQRAFPDLKIWHDQAPHGLIGGGNWWKDILAAIAASDVFIYVLSNESVNSLYCQAEFTEARRLQKRIITVQARDKTELTDDLDDIQFIDMKEGVDAPEAIPSLVAALRLRLNEAKKSRNARPLWKPATPKPNKEAPPTRTADAPPVDTPPLERPMAEQEALRLARSGVRWQIIGVVISVILGVAALGLTAAQLLRDNAPTDPTTPPSTTDFEIADVPTQAESPSATLTPSITPTATEDVAATQAAQFQASLTALGVLQEQGAQTATADAATRAAASQLDATLRAAADTATANAIAITQSVLGETATQQSIEATRTREAEIAIQNLTATADAWTDTPTPTLTPSPIPPTATPTPDPLQAALIAARSFTGSNADWQALYPDGFRYTFEDGVPMVLVPAGSFTIGANPQQDDERGSGVITFSEPFWIDLTEVTQADFERLGGEAANESYFTGDDRPVEQITWFEARDFCARRGARLPTEAEWEYAARGPAEWDYPWGAAWNASNAVWNRSSSQGTANVGSIPAGRSWVGAFDLSGNVWEWTSSLYLPYDSTEDREADTGARTDVLRVLRGGSWGNYSVVLRSANRNRFNPDNRFYNFGFRCARSS